MSKTSTYQTPLRRRKEGKTNYSKRMAYLKSSIPRIVVRKSSNHTTVQFVETKKGIDSVLASAHTKELGKFKYTGHGGNIPAAYLTGFLAGKRYGIKQGKEAIVDIGVQQPVLGSRIFAAVKGAIDAGINVRANPKAFPKEERLEGKHVEQFAQTDQSKNNKVQFASYSRQKVDATTFSKMVKEAKKTITETVIV